MSHVNTQRLSNIKAILCYIGLRLHDLICHSVSLGDHVGKLIRESGPPGIVDFVKPVICDIMLHIIMLVMI